MDVLHTDQINDPRPIHLYFGKTPPSGRLTKIKEVSDSLPRQMVFCDNWNQFTEMLNLKPASLCVNDCHFTNSSFIETISMIETLAKLVNGDPNITLTLGVNADTKYSLIKEAQKSRMIGIVPSTVDFPLEDCLRGLNAQWSNIPYWPKNIIENLPGAPRPHEHATNSNITLTPRQQQIFSILKERGCSNKHIAKIVGISESTVKLHLSKIFKKLGVKNRTQLTIFSKEDNTL